MLRLLELTYENLVEFVADRYGKGSFLARTLYDQFYKHLDPDAWQAEIIRNSKGLKDRLRQDWRFSPGQVIDEVHEGGLVKFVTALTDGNRIESVILPLKTHQTVCVSSQAGCNMGATQEKPSRP